MERGKQGAKRLLLALVMAFCCGCSGLPASSRLPDHHVEAEPPPAFIDFCARFADQCAKTPGAPIVLTLDEQTMRQITQVNHAVNTAIAPQTDLAHYGRDEFWTIPSDGYGDCEDYALSKREDLLKAGLPASALRLAVVYSIKTALHAVLTVSTDKGDLVLDNMSDAVVPWNATGFTWIMVQSPTDPLRWDSLRPGSERSGGNTAHNRVSVTNLLTDPDGDK